MQGPSRSKLFPFLNFVKEHRSFLEHVSGYSCLIRFSWVSRRHHCAVSLEELEMDSRRTEQPLDVCHNHYAKNCFLVDAKLTSIAEDLENFECPESKPLGFVEDLI